MVILLYVNFTLMASVRPPQELHPAKATPERSRLFDSPPIEVHVHPQPEMEEAVPEFEETMRDPSQETIIFNQLLDSQVINA